MLSSQYRTQILLVQLGSPKSPSPQDVSIFLKIFLSDPRVVDTSSLWWKILLRMFIIPLRKKKVAKNYSTIWDGAQFPLVRYTNEFAEKVHHICQQKTSGMVNVSSAFILSTPTLEELIQQWQKEGWPFEELLIIPQFPQYSESTTASVWDVLNKSLGKSIFIPRYQFIPSYYNSSAFIDCGVAQIQQFLQSFPAQELVFSFHGLPAYRVEEKKDPYYEHCLRTYELLKQKLNGSLQVHFSFQSRFGRSEWLKPYTEKLVLDLVAKGRKNIAIYCPSFVVDCLETLEEIGHSLREKAKAMGGDVRLIPCLNTNADWCEAYADFILAQVKKDNR